jgi:hypothetical protein
MMQKKITITKKYVPCHFELFPKAKTFQASALAILPWVKAKNRFPFLLIDQQILKLGGVAIKSVEIDLAKYTVHMTLLTVLPKMPGAVNAGLFFLQVMGHP